MFSSQNHLTRFTYLAVGLSLTSACSLLAPQRDPLPDYQGKPRNILLLPMGSANTSVQAIFEETCFNNPDFSKRFQLIDRQSLEVLLKEQQLVSISALDENQISIYGKQLGAQAYIKSELLALNTSSETNGTAKYGYSTTYYGSASVSIKLVDIETGKILGIARGQGSASSSRSDYEQLKLKALSVAIDNAVYDVLKSYSKVYG